jgi:hypothetical protein
MEKHVSPYICISDRPLDSLNALLINVSFMITYLGLKLLAGGRTFLHLLKILSRFANVFGDFFFSFQKHIFTGYWLRN